jgi:hypothetical protein
VTKVTLENGKLVHENVRSYFTMQGALKEHCSLLDVPFEETRDDYAKSPFGTLERGYATGIVAPSTDAGPVAQTAIIGRHVDVHWPAQTRCRWYTRVVSLGAQVI